MSPKKDGKEQNPEVSPTRRFVKPENSRIESQMLGAGTDPLSREGEFSKLAGNARNLINAQFMKPSLA
jgi:dynein heavy chain